MTTESIVKQLIAPSTYEQQIDELHHDSKNKNNNFPDIGIQTLHLHQNKISKLLAHEMETQGYQPHVVLERIIRVKDKSRLICKLKPVDHIIQRAICQTIMPQLKEYLTTHVYSYKERSNYIAARNFARFIRQSHKNNKLDLFVIRTDVKSYTDTIPIAENSPLWEKIEDILNWLKIDAEFHEYLSSLIKQFIRPTIKMQSGLAYQRLYGLPMGSPLTAIISLIYLNDIDRFMASQPKTFYARYGDDILIAHHEMDQIIELDKILQSSLTNLGLKLNPDKHQIIFLTESGSPHPTHPNFQHSQKITYLGFDIWASGTIGLKLKAQRQLLKDTQERIRNLIQLYQHYDLQTQGKLLCRALNQSFDYRHPLANEKLLILLNCITEREQLKQLDFIIALYIAQTLSGINGTKAFRKIAYKKIRQQWKLKSLCQLRNQRYKTWTY